MIQSFINSERPVATAAAFILTYFVVLSLGRFFKRHERVPLGFFFQIFCLTLAFYVAISVYGVQGSWRNHLGAALVLLSPALIVAFVNHYLWDFYFEKKRQTPVPHILRDMLAFLLFLVALLLVLSFGYHAETQLKGLLAGSGIIAIILGFAGQNLLGAIIAGIQLQTSRPYRVGDWLQLNERYAEVMEIKWRSTRLRTNDGIYLDIPNNEIVKQTIVNLHYPTQTHAMRVRIGIDYKAPPNRVKDALMRATKNAELVLRDPSPKIYLIDFADHAVIYEIKFYMGNHVAYNDVCDAIRTNIWYELKRQQITIPYPIRTLHLERRSRDMGSEDHEQAREILRGEPLFQCLDEEQLGALLQRSRLNHFGRGERVIEEGAEGDSMFVLLRGTANVSVAKNGSAIRVGTLHSGECFGEMSLLTGERRTATVRAAADCYVLEISKPTMAEVIRQAPECLNQLSELLAKRKMETEGIIKDAHLVQGEEAKQREYSATFLRRLRTFFEL
jgi:small-conductance mechanosensitive channel/CRP-like cAMP-binding protein